MAEPISEGALGHAVGPLRPSGTIRIDGQTFPGRSEGTWIDGGAEVVVVGRTTFGLIVRPALDVCASPSEDLSPTVLPSSIVPETTPLHAPPALIEKISGLAFGVVATASLVAIGLLTGRPFGISVLSTPAAGLVAGFIFLWCVHGAFDFAGPRADHRPMAYAVALITAIGGATGMIFGLNCGFEFVGLSAGLVVGTLLGGLIAWGGIILIS